jgi:hypothetical protein
MSLADFLIRVGRGGRYDEALRQDRLIQLGVAGSLH